jgi:REP element-mobilizing transposase RayT
VGRGHRIQAAGVVYHVTTRGNNGDRIVRVAGDRLFLLTCLEGVVVRFGWICHAYCLMGNHVHLMIELVEPNLADGMQQLQCRHARRYNRRYGRSGHVFGRRYFSLPVERSEHLLELCRYIVLNPVRIGACASAEEWSWSSYRATVGLAPRPAFLTLDRVLAQFGRDEEEARREFARFVDDGLS